MSKNHKIKPKLYILFLAIMPILTTAFYIFLYERNALPVAEEIVQQKCVTSINASIGQCLKELNISSADLCTPHFDQNGKLTYMEVNSAEVNLICATGAEKISQDLNVISSEPVCMPLGVFTGINALSHLGPKIPLYLTPVGSTTADYESEAQGTGIGQVNFRVWLVTTSTVGIVNPLSHRKLTITRKLMLVNTVFSGEVPNGFYGKTD